MRSRAVPIEGSQGRSLVEKLSEIFSSFLCIVNLMKYNNINFKIESSDLFDGC